MNFKKINNISGWLAFAISYITYLMTLERTASLWDCGEFLAVAYKLEVAHSPGAPLFMILGRVFGMMTSDPTGVALLINSMSAIMSAFTILFLFWSITHFIRKTLVGNTYDNISNTDIVKIIGGGFVGALAYTFSDTFWFSAVEAEVYASSSFFTAIVFWAALKWEEAADHPHADRWLVLIFYLMGLSVGVHLLNLLTIPAIIMVYYFKRYTPSVKGGILAFFIGCLILAVLQFGIIQYLPIFIAWFELFFTNTLGLPFNTGFFVFIILLVAAVFFGLRFFQRKNYYIAHVATLCFVFATIGYSSYVTVVLRSKANVAIDMTNPDNVMSLIPYLQRDQYGSQPLFSGPYFNSKPIRVDNARNTYMPTTVDGKDAYVLIDTKPKYVFDKNYFFPRIWAWMEPHHGQFYRNYLGLGKNEEPTFADNMKFFMSYQMNWMYWRYFMWNYAGRQNDIAGQGDPYNGNWISGIKFVDQLFGKGDADLLPDYLKNNKARNQYYFLPFILGILGVILHYKKSKHDFTVVALFFFFTGIAIQLYINNTPLQPRERDYAYISTYAFAIWIGFGVVYLADLLNKALKKPMVSAQMATALSLLGAPVLMMSEGWDDHDRSQKTIARDHAINMLGSLDSNAIVITYGDNDTYPLWYIQEVEGFRTDIRIFNFNLLGTDWQNDQMLYKINDAAAIPMIWPKDSYWGKNLTHAQFYDHPRLNKNNYYDAEEIIKYFSNPKNSLPSSNRVDSISIIPTRKISIKINKDEYIKHFKLSPEQAALVLDEFKLDFKDNNSLNRGDMSLLNMITGLAKDGLKRSIYMTDGVPNLGMDAYYKYEGMLNKLTPTLPSANVQGLPDYADIDRTIKMFVDEFQFGKANTNEVYYDEKNRLVFAGYRQKSCLLALNLALQGRKADALKVLNAYNDKISQTSLPYQMTMYDKGSPQMFFHMVLAYYLSDDKASARKYADIAVQALMAENNYYKDLSSYVEGGARSKQNIDIISFLAQMVSQYGDTEYGNQLLQMIGKPAIPTAAPTMNNNSNVEQPDTNM